MPKTLEEVLADIEAANNLNDGNSTNQGGENENNESDESLTSGSTDESGQTEDDQEIEFNGVKIPADRLKQLIEFDDWVKANGVDITPPSTPPIPPTAPPIAPVTPAPVAPTLPDFIDITDPGTKWIVDQFTSLQSEYQQMQQILTSAQALQTQQIINGEVNKFFESTNLSDTQKQNLINRVANSGMIDALVNTGSTTLPDAIKESFEYFAMKDPAFKLQEIQNKGKTKTDASRQQKLNALSGGNSSGKPNSATPKPESTTSGRITAITNFLNKNGMDQ